MDGEEFGNELCPMKEDSLQDETHDQKCDSLQNDTGSDSESNYSAVWKSGNYTNAGSSEMEVLTTDPLNQSKKKGSGLNLVNEKAGMKGLDFNKINKIINENSEGSKFYEHKKKSQEKLEKQVEEMRERYNNFSEAEIRKSEKEVDKMAQLLERTRDDARIIVHIDMDCFFAAVEMRDNPALRDIPMAVGSSSMLSTSNYIARKFGVRAAMPGFLAKKLCPELVIVPTNFAKYSQVSDVAHAVYLEYDPACYSSMDEASLDLTNYVAQQNLRFDDPEFDTEVQKIVEEIRAKVFTATELTASAGIAPNGFLAKIGSDINKPNGQYFLKSCDVKNFLATLPIRKVNGIGSVTETMLKGLDINTCSDIWEKRGAVNLLFKPATVEFLIRVSMGVGSHSFGFDSGTEDRKSLSCERTFQETSDYGFIKDYCHHLCTEISSDLKSKNIKGKAVAVKIKTDLYDVKTRIKSLLDYTSDVDIIFTTAMSIFDSLRSEHSGVLTLRLFGVRISNFKFLKQKNEDCETVLNVEDSSAAGSSKFLVQPRIDKTAWKTQNKESEPCPVCFKTFSSTLKLLSHVDACIVSESTESVTAQSSSAKNQSPGVVGSNSNSKRTRNSEDDDICEPKKPHQVKHPRITGHDRHESSSKQIKMMPISSYFKPLGDSSAKRS